MRQGKREIQLSLTALRKVGLISTIKTVLGVTIAIPSVFGGSPR